MSTHWRSLLFAWALALAGCGAAAAGGAGTTPSGKVPERVTAESYGEAVRLFHRLPFDHPDRGALRERIVGHLASQTPAVLEAAGYEQVVEHFAAISQLYAPEDFARGEVPQALEPLARYLLEAGSPRGDEARALASLLVLGALHPDHPSFAREYQQVARWGRRARATLDNPMERYTKLIEVWDEHARLTPTPEVLDVVARLHVQRRDAVVQVLRSGERMGLGAAFGAFGMAPQHLLRRAPFEVTAVYLRHGDIASAITHLRSMGQVSDIEGQLLRVLQDARGKGEEAADAILELAEAYREARPDVAFGLCRMGMRRMPESPRFPKCLARVAAAEERFGDATAWYAEAIRLAPAERALYDEALEQLNEFIEQGLFEADSAGARELAGHAERILEARVERWPESPPPVGPEQLHVLIGTLEMNRGETAEARRRFEKSLEVEVTTQALLQLGLLEERMDHPRKATEMYRRALDRTPEKSPSDALKRAEILERLADAVRESGDAARAERMYRQALGLLEKVLPELEGPPRSLIQVRRGVILDRLGRHDDATEAFMGAMAAAPHWRETYAGILSHLAVSDPDPALAHEVFRRAQRQLTLEPEWKVYFALWVSLISGRAGEVPEPDVQRLLRELAQGTAWWSRLAKFGAGALPYEELLADASTLGERAEAHFYAGARRLAAGDREAARELFGRVLATKMVSFYEFVMAQELSGDETAQAAPSGDSP